GAPAPAATPSPAPRAAGRARPGRRSSEQGRVVTGFAVGGSGGGSGAGPGIDLAAAFAPPAVPPPPRDAHVVDSLDAGELCDREPGNLRIAAPFAFAGHDHVEVERGQQAQRLGTRVVVYAGEGLVEEDESRGVRSG